MTIRDQFCYKIEPNSVMSSTTINSIFDSFDERLKEIERRLYILERDKDLEDRFPALKEAYEQYNIIKELVK